MNEYNEDNIRFEWMLRRSIIKYECKKQGVDLNMHEVLQLQFQESALKRLISAVGLDRSILSRADFKKAVKPLFKTDKTYHNALQLAQKSHKLLPLLKSFITPVAWASFGFTAILEQRPDADISWLAASGRCPKSKTVFPAVPNDAAHFSINEHHVLSRSIRVTENTRC